MTVSEMELEIADAVHFLNHIRERIIKGQLTDQALPNENRNRVHTEILTVTVQRFIDYATTGK